MGGFAFAFAFGRCEQSLKQSIDWFDENVKNL